GPRPARAARRRAAGRPRPAPSMRTGRGRRRHRARSRAAARRYGRLALLRPPAVKPAREEGAHRSSQPVSAKPPAAATAASVSGPPLLPARGRTRRATGRIPGGLSGVGGAQDLSEPPGAVLVADEDLRP